MELLIEGQNVQFNIDTDSAVERVELECELSKSMVLLRTYTGDRISVVGEARVDISYHHQLTLYR